MIGEWTEINVPFYLAPGDDPEQESFYDLGLCKSGTEIELEDDYGETRRMLIGDINPMGSYCGCCHNTNPWAIVKRYRIVNLE